MSMICIKKDCINRAIYNFDNKLNAIYCEDHKLEGMRPYPHHVCIEKNCKNGATCNFISESKGLYCAKHRKPNMICITSLKCIHGACMSRAKYNVYWEYHPLYCALHKQENMVDIVSQRCITEKCGKARVYSGYCKGCFNRFCSSSKKYQMHKFKEYNIIDFLQKTYGSKNIEYDALKNSYESPIFINFEDRTILLEVEITSTIKTDIEHLNTLIEYLQDTKGVVVYVIRINIGDYRVNGKRRPSAWKEEIECVPTPIRSIWEKRMQKLKYSIDYPEKDLEELFFTV